MVNEGPLAPSIEGGLFVEVRTVEVATVTGGATEGVVKVTVAVASEAVGAECVCLLQSAILSRTDLASV